MVILRYLFVIAIAAAINWGLLFLMQALDVGAYRTRVNLAPVDPDFVVGRNRNEDIGLFFLLRSLRVRPVYVDSGLLYEGRGDNKENEHDEDHIQHGRDVDLALFLLDFLIGKHLTHTVFLSGR